MLMTLWLRLNIFMRANGLGIALKDFMERRYQNSMVSSPQLLANVRLDILNSIACHSDCLTCMGPG